MGTAEPLEHFQVKTPRGRIEASALGSGSTIIVLGHGAGSHMGHRTMDRIAQLFPTDCVVVRFNFLYRQMNKSIPDRMPILVETYRAVVEAAHGLRGRNRLILGGHSMGGRVASMLLAEETLAEGLILFGYPLHPPGNLEKLRTEHLSRISVPVLQLSGDADPFCTPTLMEQAVANHPSWRVDWIAGGDHSYAVKKSFGVTPADVDAQLRASIAEWLSKIPDPQDQH